MMVAEVDRVEAMTEQSMLLGRTICVRSVCDLCNMSCGYDVTCCCNALLCCDATGLLSILLLMRLSLLVLLILSMLPFNSVSSHVVPARSFHTIKSSRPLLYEPLLLCLYSHLLRFPSFVHAELDTNLDVYKG